MPDAPSWQLLERTARELVVDASDHGITLRLVGSLGVRLHCEPMIEVLQNTKRAPKDVDMVCRRRDASRLRRHFEGKGYEVDRDLLVAMEGHRYTFRHPDTNLEVDVFVDKLDFCHTIDIRDRLDGHPLTISLEDLILHKLQIVKLTDGDRIDVEALLQVHDVAARPEGGEAIDGSYVAALLSGDWGFWRTATANLARLEEEARLDSVRQRIAGLSEAIAAHAKTTKWKLRARIGERMQWWQDVQDPEATYR